MVNERIPPSGEKVHIFFKDEVNKEVPPQGPQVPQVPQMPQGLSALYVERDMTNADLRDSHYRFYPTHDDSSSCLHSRFPKITMEVGLILMQSPPLLEFFIS